MSISRFVPVLLCATLMGASLAPRIAAAQEPGPPRSAAERDSLEQRVRMRMTQMLRTQLGMNDEQIRRFQLTNRRFERQRIGLFAQEREVRAELRGLVEGGDTASHARVGTLLDRIIQLQRQRLELQEAEQQELATFLNPVQRARLYGIEEQIRRRMESLRDGPQGGRMNQPPMRPGGRPGPGGRRPPM